MGIQHLLGAVAYLILKVVAICVRMSAMWLVEPGKKVYSSTDENEQMRVLKRKKNTNLTTNQV
jgi:hypothetical protein